MLKETETEKQLFFWDIFIIGSISIGRSRPPGYAYVKGLGPLGSTLLLITAVLNTRVMLYAKMLKKTETEETILFFVTFLSEVESSRTSLASRTSSRTHFEVLGLGLEALGPRKLPCPRLEDSTIF